jgi:hypothetical protein
MVNVIRNGKKYMKTGDAIISVKERTEQLGAMLRDKKSQADERAAKTFSDDTNPIASLARREDLRAMLNRIREDLNDVRLASQEEAYLNIPARAAGNKPLAKNI